MVNMCIQAGFSVNFQCNFLSLLICDEDLFILKQKRKGSNIKGPDKKEKPPPPLGGYLPAAEEGFQHSQCLVKALPFPAINLLFSRKFTRNPV